MNIRKCFSYNKNTNCRECDREIRESVHHKVGDPPSTGGGEPYFQWYIKYENLRNDLTKYEREKNKVLYILSGRTASGSGNEVICKKHLQELIQKIQKALEEQ